MNVIGYTDRLSVDPGGVVRARFSTTADELTARLVRLVNGDPHPLGPGVDIRGVPSGLDGAVFPGREQPIRSGSRIESAAGRLPGGTVRVELATAVRPTLPVTDHDQVLVVLRQDGDTVLRLALDRTGTPSMGGAPAAAPLARDRWYRVALSVDTAAGTAVAVLTPDAGTPVELHGPSTLDPARPVSVVFGAEPDGAGHARDHLNGRLHAPTLAVVGGSGVRTEVAAWDLGPSRRLRRVDNRLGADFGAVAVNLPVRACLGPDGAPDDVDPRLAPDAYQAVHLHDDDLDDAGWDDDVVLTVPEDLPSGVYGIEVTASDGTQDTLPFVVTPGARPTSDVLLVLPTFSYLAYSCEHVMADPGARDYLAGVGIDDVPEFGGNRHDAYLLAHGLRSLYDVHTDGSGVCFASTQKPLPNIRHDHRWAAVAGGATSAHQFSADLHLVAWLDSLGERVDVVTDEEVHRHGADLLARYRVVLTGSHPEYPTTPMLHAYETYLERGGRLMYLGGNGFYWVTSVDPEQGHTIEIRRTAGIRAWQPEPGEWHHATTGELGGLWRLRGRSPQALLGVGMAAQGFDENRPYAVVVDRDDPRAGFVLAGTQLPGGLLGDTDSMVNGRGAAGVEIDRVDAAWGTPDDTVVLATASGFSRAYGLDPVEVNLPDGCYDGTTSDRVRCDLVLVPKPNGGAVFSTGSIAWCGSLLVDGGRNDVARVTRNVLQGFRSDAAPWAADPDGGPLR